MKNLLEDKEKFGKDYLDILTSQYLEYMSSVDKLIDRRQNLNNIFIIINTSLLSVFNVFIQRGVFEGRNPLIIVFTTLGITLSLIHWTILKRYKAITTAKYTIIYELEKKLPANLYRKEWELIRDKKGAYHAFSSLEKKIPLLFGSLYAIIFLAVLLGIV